MHSLGIITNVMIGIISVFHFLIDLLSVNKVGKILSNITPTIYNCTYILKKLYLQLYLLLLKRIAYIVSKLEKIL